MKSNKFTKLFLFKMPYFRQLVFEQVIIGEKAYLLISWESSYATKLTIKTLCFLSRRAKGSAYIAINSEVSSLELKIGNFWRSLRIQIELKKILLNRQVDYDPVMKKAELPISGLYRPVILNKFTSPPIPKAWSGLRTVNMRIAIKSSKINYGK